ncbi:host attachment protein [Mesorhizobium atlanticum]
MLIEQLEYRHAAHEFDRLAIVAEPRMLGVLRQKLSPKLSVAVIKGSFKGLDKAVPRRVAQGDRRSRRRWSRSIARHREGSDLRYRSIAQHRRLGWCPNCPARSRRLSLSMPKLLLVTAP